MAITTTLNKIRSFQPCKEGWTKLLITLGKTAADDEPVSYATILQSNGVQDTIWCMRCEWFEHKEVWMQFVNGCAERANKYKLADADAAAYAAASAAYTAYAAYAAYAAADAAYAAADDAERSKQYEHLLHLVS